MEYKIKGFFCQAITTNTFNENQNENTKFLNTTLIITFLSYAIIINLLFTMYLLNKIKNNINNYSSKFILELNNIVNSLENEEECVSDPVVHESEYYST